jgi:hypothetical protein
MLKTKISNLHVDEILLPAEILLADMLEDIMSLDVVESMMEGMGAESK